MGYPSTHTLFSSFFLRHVYKAARVTQAEGLPYLHARVIQASGFPFSPFKTPGRVNPLTQANVLIVSRPFECNCTLRRPRLYGYPTCEILL